MIAAVRRVPFPVQHATRTLTLILAMAITIAALGGGTCPVRAAATPQPVRVSAQCSAAAHVARITTMQCCVAPDVRIPLPAPAPRLITASAAPPLVHTPIDDTVVLRI